MSTTETGPAVRGTVAKLAAGLAMGVPLVLLIVFLLVRPTGLLKAREARA